MSRSSTGLSNLRAVVIVIVLAFHAALPYLAWAPRPPAPFNEPPYIWQAFPILDSVHWFGFDLFCAWQDVSLMSLMFLLSGLLISGSLRRKGFWTYVADRLRRIGLPFVAAIVVLSPLAYYPAWLLRATASDPAGFLSAWLALPLWPVGPQWFLWQLLAANLLAALLFTMVPASVAWLERTADWAARRPAAFAAALIAVSMLAYGPLALIYSPWRWDAVGPFTLQTSRPLHYLVYFAAGVALGSRGLDHGLLRADGPLARHWRWWLAAALAGFFLWAGLTALTQPRWENASLAARIGASLAFPVGCATGSLLFLALALRFGGRPSRILDSLSGHAYSIYLLHYGFIVWLQYALLPASLAAPVKAAIVFGLALPLSWGASVLTGRLRRPAPAVVVRPAATPMPHG